MKKLIIDNDISVIGDSAFMDSKRLMRIHFGKKIDNIGKKAFSKCPYIIEIHAPMEFPPLIDASVFEECGDLSEIDCYVSKESLPLYKKTNVWNKLNLKENNATEPSTTPINCTINYVDKEDALVGSEQVTFYVPDAPVFEGFKFVNWRFIESDMIDGLTIQAIYEPDEISSAPEVVTNPNNPAQKLIRNGNIYFLTDDSRTYTLTGQQVR